MSFPHAVASFDPTAEGVVLWTRAPDQPRLEWVVASDPGLADVAAEGEVEVDRTADDTATVEVGGLPSGREWYYAFRGGDGWSPVGSTRTLAASPERVRIGFVCCSDPAAAPLTAYRALAAQDLDLVVHLGDYIYEHGEGDDDFRALRPPHACVSLSDYRERYAQVREDPDVIALHLRHPVVAIWDDHDIADNAWRGGAKAHDPAEQGPWAERLAAATRARQEWLPARLGDHHDPARLWRSVVLGDLAELVVLDVRLGGRDEQADSAGDGLDDPQRSLLGDEQRAWMTQRLADRSRPWVVVTSQVPVAEMRLPLPTRVGFNETLPDGYLAEEGVAVCTDQWDGYPAERDRLLTAADAHGGGVVIVSGDVHSAWVFDSPTDRAGAPEVTISGVSSPPMGARMRRAGAALAKGVANSLDHVRSVDLDHNGYGIVELSAERLVAELWQVEPDDDEARSTLGSAWSVGPAPGARWEQETDPETGPGRARRWWIGRLARVATGAAAVAAVLEVLRRRRPGSGSG